MTLCTCTWHWNFRATPRRPEDHMEGICPLYAPPPAAKARCTCHLADGPAETVVAELHDEDCALYLAALNAEAVAADERIVREG